MNSLQVLILCCLVYQSIAGGPSYQSSSSSRPMCMTCRYIVTQITSDFEQITEDCDPGTGFRTGIRLVFASDRPDLSGYCIHTNEPISPNEWVPALADYVLDSQNWFYNNSIITRINKNFKIEWNNFKFHCICVFVLLISFGFLCGCNITFTDFLER